jgi:hypothetical protein
MVASNGDSVKNYNVVVCDVENRTAQSARFNWIALRVLESNPTQ